MAPIHVSAERVIDAPAPTVYGYLADMREHHPRFLPPAFEDFRVEAGGVGAGTVVASRSTPATGAATTACRCQSPSPEGCSPSQTPPPAWSPPSACRARDPVRG